MAKSSLQGPVDILTGFQRWFEGKTGVKTLLEPQLIENPEPTLRITYRKTSRQGTDRERIFLVGILSAYGIGPSTYLDSVLRASRKIALLFDEEGSCADKIEIAVGTPSMTASACLSRLTDGEFVENEREGSRFPIVYNEQFSIQISYNARFIEEEV